MVQARIAGLAVDAAGQHVLLLKPIDTLPGEGEVLPIWIGGLEATSIMIAIQGAPVPRPLAHDLMRSLLETLEAEVAGVAVTRIDDGTYYAEITLSTASGSHVVDARPSDAVALAARTGAPITVADDVMDEAGVPDMTADEDDDERLDEFKRFLDDVEPEDFRG
ncbi:bifunctional nuclease family protein [Microbacterium sp.]|uniref:bifunctional nuclease family protein n=1 Tax=Microbacterium sp. TaxID=51671 RepID=UPI003221F4EA